MKSSEYQSRAEQVVLHTYNRFPVVLDHGKGVRLYDVDGNEYLDFGAGIAVCALGYGDPDYEEARCCIRPISITMCLPWKPGKSW